ncbi:hypothetical protein [Haemophilus influenzae]|jgi:hypothetical protein|uniref:hypothetical protein n=1 Tax=Haemophilus influenzae TaxID=727 RepID=UPI000D01BFC9|nr:hypothetical protein [Haemophilus influenzae]PRI89400.1 hypothetical protein BV025_00429 [Haemophilus influenzae]PRM49141.1 hypothetical protein BVZ64_00641 [Haemophilus influenzae]
MSQKLSKYELISRLLSLKEKQDELTIQVQHLTQEMNTLIQPYMPKEPKPSSLITVRWVAQVLRENRRWLFCGEIAEKVLALTGNPQFVDIGDKHYKAVNRILLRLHKQGIVECAARFWRLKPIEQG